MAQTNWFVALAEQGLEVSSARDAAYVVGWLDSGNYALNWAISGRFGRGYPLGHTVEIFGDPSTGKSFLITRAIAQAQAQGGVALLDDTESAYNLEWMQTLGVNIDNLAYEHSITVKEHLALARRFYAAYSALHDAGKVQGPGVFACDSLALLSTDHEQKVQLDKRDMTRAGELKALFRIMMGDLYALPVVYLSTNHKIANIGNMFQKTTTPGGGGPKYQASIRIDLRSISKIKDKSEDAGDAGTNYLGVICRAVVDKNRLTAPWKEVRLAIPFYQPLSPASGLIPLLLSLGVLEEVNHMLLYNGRKLKLRAYKDRDRMLRQDEEAEKLLDMEPELLEEADVMLALMEKRRLDSEQTDTEDAV